MRRKNIAVIILFFILKSGLWAQENVQYKQFTIENGLAGNDVYCIHQDAYNFLWFGTNYGLSRFDGMRFYTYRNKYLDSTSISSNYIRKITSTKNKNLLIISNTGIEYFDYDKNTFQRLYSISLFPKDYISIKNYQDRNYLQIKEELLVFDEQTLTVKPFFDNDTLKILDFFIDNDNQLWFYLTNRKLLKYSLENNQFNYIENADTIINSTPLFCSYLIQNYIINQPRQTLENDTIYHFLLKNNIRNWQKQNDKIWFTKYGLYCYDLKTDKTQKISSNLFISLFIDKSGTLWAGTSQSGVWQISNKLKKFEKYELFPEKTDRIYTIYAENDSIAWLGSDGYGLVRYNLNNNEKQIFTNLNTPALKTNYLRIIKHFDKDNILVIAVGSMFLINKNTLTVKPLNIPDTIETSFYDIMQLKDGFVVATINNLYRIKPPDFKFEYVNNLKIRNFFTDNQNRIWATTSDSGIMLLDKAFSLKKHFLHNSNDTNSLSHNWVSSMLQDKNGIIWFGTANGLTKYDEQKNKFAWYSEADGMSSNVILSLACDDDNNLWIASNGGISKMNTLTNEIINFTINDGLQGKIFFRNAVVKTPKGKLIFGGNKGFNAFYPDNIKQNNYKPPVVITEFRLFNKKIKPNDSTGILTKNSLNTQKIELNYDQNTFSFHFSALNYIQPNKNLYSYRLINFDKDWNNAGNKQVANYMNIPPGNYTFKVIAANNDGVWNREGRKIELIIKPPFWQTWWFRILVAFIVVGGGVAFYFWRINKIKAQNILLEKRVEQRTNQLNVVINELKEQKIQVEQQNEEIERQKEDLNKTVSLLKKQKVELEEKNEEIESQKQNLNKTVKQLKEKKIELEQKNEEIQNQNEKIKQMMNQLEEFNQAKIRFFTNISHEFRTPLTLISGPVQKIIEIATDEKVQYQAKMVFRNTKKMLNLINELLDFRKIETDNLKLHFSKVNIVEYVREIYRNFYDLMQKKQIDFKFECAKKNIFLFVDLTQFEKIINNLLSNAYKFTEKNETVIVKIEKYDKITQQFPEGCCRLSIKDTGQGIDSEKIHEIFNRYFQADTYQTLNELKSSGIGLALTRKLVELHYGNIAVESKVDVGTEFIISLPLGKKHLSNIELSDNLQKQFVSTLPDVIDDFQGQINNNPNIQEKQKYVIQIVEDNHEVRQFLQNELQSEYQLLIAENGKIGYEQALKNVPDLIISDVMMPEMDGIEFCEKIKTTPATSHIPIILLTSKTSDENRLKGFQYGADAYINKPFYMEMLKIRIRNILQHDEFIRLKFQNSNEIIPIESTKNDIDARFLEKTVKIIKENLSNIDFNSQTLYEKMGMSRTNFYRKLKAITGNSASNFIRNVRIKSSIELFSADKTISEVAYEVGFSNISYFSASFKKQFGLTPTEYQQQKYKIVINEVTSKKK